MAKRDYEREYHGSFHERLINDSKYYSFRAIYADKIYWPNFKNANSGRFLEFGSGMGQNILLHKQNAIGIEISEFARKECLKKGIITKKDIKNIPGKSIGGILCCHVLEHIENPKKIVKEFFRALKPGGILVLVLPTCKEINCAPDLTAGHLFSWTVPTIWTLLHSEGFKMKKTGYNYSSGFSLFYKLPPKLAIFLVKMLGILRRQKEILIIAEKP